MMVFPTTNTTTIATTIYAHVYICMMQNIPTHSINGNSLKFLKYYRNSFGNSWDLGCHGKIFNNKIL